MSSFAPVIIKQNIGGTIFRSFPIGCNSSATEILERRVKLTSAIITDLSKSQLARTSSTT